LFILLSDYDFIKDRDRNYILFIIEFLWPKLNTHLILSIPFPITLQKKMTHLYKDLRVEEFVVLQFSNDEMPREEHYSEDFCLCYFVELEASFLKKYMSTTLLHFRFSFFLWVRNEITGALSFFFFFAVLVLGFSLRVSCLLHKCSTA
jgi:hypothetical protein